MYSHVANIKRHERENLIDLDNWGFIVVLENCSYFCVRLSSEYITKSHTIEE